MSGWVSVQKITGKENCTNVLEFFWMLIHKNEFSIHIDTVLTVTTSVITEGNPAQCHKPHTDITNATNGKPFTK